MHLSKWKHLDVTEFIFPIIVKSSFKCREQYVSVRPDLSSVVGTVFSEDVVYLWILDGAEHQRLSVVSSPVVQVPHPHSGKVHSMGVQRLQVHVFHHMLVEKGRKEKTLNLFYI